MLHENIFLSLTSSSSFFRVVFPHLKEEYFSDSTHCDVFKKIKQYNDTYSKQPTISDIKLLVESDNSISESQTDCVYEFLANLKNVEVVTDEQLLIKKTEEFCQSRALENAILESVGIIQDKTKSKGSIEDLVKKALAVEFDVKIGNDFFKDAPSRYAAYIEHEECILSDIDVINLSAGGGFRKKALSCFLGGTNSGKSLILCHLACSFLSQGKNVLYLSAEMSESMIGRRLDSNLLDIPMNDINEDLDKKSYLSKIKDIFGRTKGKLIIKEYPTGSAHAGHIKNLLNEIKSKRGFVPDVILLDYLNIFASSRLGHASGANSYSQIKSVCEEIRGVAVEFDTAIITATQTNRSGQNLGSDLDMTSVSDSHGLAMTVDLLIGIISTPELFEQNKYCFKVLKSRFNDNINKVYTLGVERSKMRLLNLAEEEQEIPIHVRDQLRQQQQKQNQELNETGFDFS